MTEYGTTLHAVATGKKIASDASFGVGPEGAILMVQNNSLKVLSAAGTSTHVDLTFRLPTEVTNILSSPDHPDIVLVLSEYGLGQGVKRLSTNPDVLDQRLRLWGQ